MLRFSRVAEEDRDRAQDENSSDRSHEIDGQMSGVGKAKRAHLVSRWAGREERTFAHLTSAAHATICTTKAPWWAFSSFMPDGKSIEVKPNYTASLIELYICAARRQN